MNRKKRKTQEKGRVDIPADTQDAGATVNRQLDLKHTALRGVLVQHQCHSISPRDEISLLLPLIRGQQVKLSAGFATPWYSQSPHLTPRSPITSNIIVEAHITQAPILACGRIR